jgi:hypothetical protein
VLSLNKVVHNDKSDLIISREVLEMFLRKQFYRFFQITFILIALTLFVIGCKPSDPIIQERTAQEDTAASSESTSGADMYPEYALYDTEPIYGQYTDEQIAALDLDEESIEFLSAPDDYEPLPDTTYTKLHNLFYNGSITQEHQVSNP